MIVASKDFELLKAKIAIIIFNAAIFSSCNCQNKNSDSI